MEHLVECIPNVSEAVEETILDRMGQAIEAAPDVWLLDRTSDRDHARSVFTMAGSIEGVRAAAEDLVAIAVEMIDLRQHAGQHPRIGAADVVPFVPLGSTTMTEAVDLAQGFAASIAERHGLPVYLYGRAARQPAHRVLADVRRPGFEGLAQAMTTSPGSPDAGPARPHPSAGATAVGARPFLIAWNIDLDGRDASIARRIARRVRERDGGLPGIQALGLTLATLDRVQVSMNVLDHARTPLWQVWEQVTSLAADEGLEVIESELIGLAPAAAFLAVADHAGVPTSAPDSERVSRAAAWLRIRDASSSMALELRLQDAREAARSSGRSR